VKSAGGALLALVLAFACAPAPVRAQMPKAPASGAAASGPAAVAVDSLDVDSALSKLDAALRWDPLSRIGSIETVRHRIVFRAEAGKSPPAAAIMDGAELIRAAPPYLADGELRFPADFVSAALGAFNRAAEVERSRFRVAAILVDPGHGGRDAGAVGRHVVNGKKLELKEKDVVLDVSRDLFDRLSKTYPDKRILMTRTGDTYPTLEQRVDIANSVSLAENEAILFVSIHANASFNKTARGYEVWYLSPEYRRTVIDAERYADSAEVLPILNAMMEEEFTTESLLIARSIMDNFDRAIGKLSPSRGIKAEEWFVVRNARMPSVLVELGFITNPEDAALLSDSSYLRRQSEAIYSGIKDFITKFERTGGFTAVR
jgi:N-acetylmuramoyl-L-alanine amidase